MVDICIIGSGAGAAPIAYELSKAGAKVVVLEKGDFYREEDFSKDEIAFCRRSIITPKLKEECHLIEDKEDGAWVATPTYSSGWDFWNGNIVGGSSNLMSGFFHRLHPKIFVSKVSLEQYQEQLSWIGLSLMRSWSLFMRRWSVW